MEANCALTMIKKVGIGLPAAGSLSLYLRTSKPERVSGKSSPRRNKPSLYECEEAPIMCGSLGRRPEGPTPASWRLTSPLTSLCRRGEEDQNLLYPASTTADWTPKSDKSRESSQRGFS